MRRSTLVALVIAMSAAGCSSATEAPSTTATAATTSSTAAASTTAPPTGTTGESTTVPESTTTTTTVTTTRTPAPFVAGTPTLGPPEPFPGSDGAAGSGCAPGAGPLPDGVWFGYVLDRDETSVSFDLACFYFGEVAYQKGGEAGVEVDNDYYVANTNATLRTVPVDAATTVYEISADQVETFRSPAFADWPVDPAGYIPCPGEYCGVWLYINDGRVTEVVEQYVP